MVHFITHYHRCSNCRIFFADLHLCLTLGWSRDCLQEWGAFIRLALPSMLMLCVKWWTYEIGGFLAGLQTSCVFM